MSRLPVARRACGQIAWRSRQAACIPPRWGAEMKNRQVKRSLPRSAERDRIDSARFENRETEKRKEKKINGALGQGTGAICASRAETCCADGSIENARLLISSGRGCGVAQALPFCLFASTAHIQDYGGASFWKIKKPGKVNLISKSIKRANSPCILNRPILQDNRIRSLASIDFFCVLPYAPNCFRSSEHVHAPRLCGELSGTLWLFLFPPQW